MLLCDSGNEIGQGHLFRCRAFAAHLQDLGWQTMLLELHVRNAASQPPAFKWKKRARARSSEWYVTLQLQALQNFLELPAPVLFLQAPKLIVLDSYHLPGAFYSYIAEAFPHSALLAIDDSADQTRLHYPERFFVLQALYLPKNLPEQATRYLYGLQYQVLRKEFCNAPKTVNLSRRFVCCNILLVSGSGLSIQQVQELVQVIVNNAQVLVRNAEIPTLNTAEQKIELTVLLSPRQMDELPALPKEDRSKTVFVHYVGGLSELRPLYERTNIAFCAAGQSLLEQLALHTRARICALLCADNQEALLRCLHQSGLALPFVDLRLALSLSSKKLSRLLESALLAMRFPAFSLATNKEICQLGDGKAVQRILLRLGL